MNPEAHITTLLWLPLLGLATLFAGAVVAIIWRFEGRVLPPRQSRAAYWAGLTVFAPVALAAVPLAAWAGKVVAVIGFAGWDAYAGGLRVVNNKGLLSDGRYLSGFWDAASGAVFWAVLLVLAAVAAGWHLHFHPPRAGTDPEGGSPGTPDAAADGGGT